MILFKGPEEFFSGPDLCLCEEGHPRAMGVRTRSSGLRTPAVLILAAFESSAALAAASLNLFYKVKRWSRSFLRALSVLKIEGFVTLN